MPTEEQTATLAKVRRIIVHPGLAHLDDIIACAIAYAFGVPHDAGIERRKPDCADLESTATLVLDIGMVYEPELLNFDHHQRTRQEEPKCSFVLLAEWLGVDQTLKSLFPWYETWNLLDVIGPFATAAQLGTTGEKIAGLVENPLGNWVIRHFADDPAFRAKVALGLAKEIDKTLRCWESFTEKVLACTIADLKIGDLRPCSPDEISRCSESWARLHSPACMISFDNRGTGLTLLRYNDHPALDFGRCAGKDYASFIHPGGFILKTVSRECELEKILEDAKIL